MRLLEVKEKYAVGTEEEAKQAMEFFRNDAVEHGYFIKSSAYTYKCKKAKGEVIAEQYVVEVVKGYEELWNEI